MNANWLCRETASGRCISYVPWLKLGIEHGFGCAGFLPPFPYRELSQPHGTAIVSLSAVKDEGIIPEADGWFLAATDRATAVIRTADCLPVVIRNNNEFALIHAGWRGLAGGIVTTALSLPAFHEYAEIIIGPCASGAAYEVGHDVISGFGVDAVYTEKGSQRCMLDMPATLALQLARTRRIGSYTVEWCGICTIADTRFISFRRDGEKIRRNLNFISR